MKSCHFENDKSKLFKQESQLDEFTKVDGGFVYFFKEAILMSYLEKLFSLII